METAYTGKDRRNHTSRMIAELLQERNHLWLLYCSIAGLKPFTPEKPVESHLKDFCQRLVDYLALSHFGVYQRIANGQERRQKVVQTAESIYPAIARATDAAMGFNDKYEGLSGQALVNSLSEDLSQLGEQLALRNDLEDQLIEVLEA